MKTALRNSAWITVAFAASVGCRVGYDEVRSIVRGGAAGTDSGGNAGTSAGGAAGTNRGGSSQGGSSGSTIGPGGDAGEPSTGGASGTGGTAGTAGVMGEGGDAGASSGGASGGASGSGGGGVGDAGGAGAGGSGGGAGAPDPALCNSATFGGHTYLLCKEERNWAAANSGCITAGMRLVRIDDAAENEWLFDNAFTEVGRNSLVWIGATDLAIEGEWRWTDGELFWIGNQLGMAQNGLFAGWDSREPNNVSTAEHCASLESNGSMPNWYDTRCELATPYICESL